jgi:hypothetical protein
MVGFFLLVVIGRTLLRGNIEWPPTKLVNMILRAARCCSLLNIRIRMPCMLMFLSLDITAKTQITEMTLEWKYSIIPNIFARVTRIISKLANL